MKPFVLSCLLLLGAVSFADTLKLETPADNAAVTQFHPAQEMLVRLGLDDWKTLIAEKSIADYWQKEVKSYPRGVRID